MKRILVTGKSSFIAGHFARHMESYRDGYSVELVSVRGDSWKGIDFSRYDCVIHAAGIAHVGYRDELRDEYMKVNRDLTLDIAKAAKAAGVKQFIFLSSIIIYGPAAKAGKTRYITADTVPAPENAYGESKLLAERGLEKLSDAGFHTAILRLPMVYGEGCRGNYALLTKYADLLPVFPAKCGFRSAIAVESLAEKLRRCIDANACGVFFPQDDEYMTTPGMLRDIRSARGKKTCITSVFDWAISLFGNIGVMRRIFGGIAYDKTLPGI